MKIQFGKIAFDISKKAITFYCISLIAVSLIALSANVSVMYPQWKREGYEQALTDLQARFGTEDFSFTWQRLGDGVYNFTFYYQGKLITSISLRPVANCHIWHYDSNGRLVSYSHHPMTTTNTTGKEWIEQQLFNPNASQKALYFACSNESDAVVDSWTYIPGEITDGGLARMLGTYVNVTTGNIGANITGSFSVSATRSTKLYALYADTVASYNCSLICAEQQGVGNQKNMNSGDTLQWVIQWSLT